MAENKSKPEENQENQSEEQVVKPEEVVETPAEIVEAVPVEEDDHENGVEDAILTDQKESNTFLKQLMDVNFLEYASYVIKDRAIPDVDDGLKPVQRRILWSLFKMDDGKFHKVANVIGHTMQFHPHGDASIGSALVVLANKEYYIEKQGNFGNILTGDEASAARYIECRLTGLAKEVLYNNDITEFLDSYDGRNKEPIVLPVKVPSLLMLGADGIAVGMATHIMPHNFKELLEAQIAILRNEDFEVYPDFLQGGTMDVKEYEEGNGKITLRAKIIKEGRKLIIREIPATTTTESIIASIEKAANRNKIKIASINDFTAENIEIEITPVRGYDPDKALKALYAYTDCSVSVSVNLTVIRENQPVQMTVSEVLKRNTEKLQEYLRRELEIELAKLLELFHQKTLEQIFIENRIYKRIEECKTNEKVFKEVRAGLDEFRKLLNRDITDEDIQRLLSIPIRRISLFDINKNKKDLDEILEQIDEINKNLKRLKAYTIKYLESLIEKYGELFPRRTEIEHFDKIDRTKVALNNIKIGWDRKNGYIGTNVKSDELIRCNEYDHLLLVERTGQYKVINITDKVYVGKLFEFRKYDKDTEFGVIYTDKKTKKTYAKRCVIDKFITDREYQLCPDDCRLEVFTPRSDSVYQCEIDIRRGEKTLDINLKEAPLRSAKARGFLATSKLVNKIKFLNYLEPDEEEENEMTEMPEGETASESETPPAEIETTEMQETVNEVENQPEEIEEPEPEKEPAPEKQAEDKPEKKPKTEEKPKAKAEKKKEPVPEPEAEPEPEKPKKEEKTEKKVDKKPEVEPEPEAPKPEEKEEKSEEKSKNKPEDKPKDKDDDNWGITQPEFGF